MARPEGTRPRFFTDADLPDMGQVDADAPPSVTLGPEESHHACRVLRLKAGDVVELFDGQGRLWQATLTTLGRDAVGCTLVPNSGMQAPPPKIRVTVASAIPKGSAAQQMIDMLSQAGADGFIPLRTARSVVDPRQGKQDKWRRQAIESAKQCGRLHLMRVEPACTLDDLCQMPAPPGQPRRILLPDGQPVGPCADVEVTAMLLLVGPEGGFTAEERDQACACGFEPWRIGDYVMRIETAAVVAAAMARSSI